jgi:hypothetical protein
MEELKALETFASMVSTLPTGTALENTTWLTEAVTVIRLQCLLAAILEARSILARSSPPKRLSKGFVSPGKTRSVIMVKESFGILLCILNRDKQFY